MLRLALRVVPGSMTRTGAPTQSAEASDESRGTVPRGRKQRHRSGNRSGDGERILCSWLLRFALLLPGEPIQGLKLVNPRDFVRRSWDQAIAIPDPILDAMLAERVLDIYLAIARQVERLERDKLFVGNMQLV